MKKKSCAICVCSSILILAACESKPAEPESKGTESTPVPQSEQSPAKATTEQAATQKSAGGDPMQGKFTLEQATEGLEGKGPLFAEIRTTQGKLDCKLFDDKAPITVANFIGLARGIRPWKDPNNEWVKKPAYDGTTFHRIIKGFMIQGGDAKGTGAGEPGYVIPDEIWPGARHDQRGLLCMANRGPNTNGAQFFITDRAAPHLDGGYTIFGKCGPDSVIEALASVPVRGERPIEPPKIEKVVIRRGAAAKGSP
jgi:peptidyl-prolyl cis-trans isomerase A (cyclophilin A)